MCSIIAAARLAALSVVLAGLLAAVPARAGGKPFPSQSWVDPTLVVCPVGDSTFLVVPVRFEPIAGSEVVLDFAGCGAAQFPPPDGTEDYTWLGSWPQSRTAVVFADVLGRAEFRLRAGGTCGAGAVGIWADGQPLGVRALASFDQDGNMGVGPEDVAIAAAKLGSGDPTADFDGDGIVTAADLDILRAHLGHHAPGMATPVASRSWGTLKLLYR